jgi:hypothetical protein
MEDKRKVMTPFCDWLPWKNRDDLPGKEHPGIYLIARSSEPITGSFSWRKEILYIGMTRGKAGLIGRLKQFQSGIVGGKYHGPAERYYERLVREKEDINTFVSQLYVSASYTECCVASNGPSDLRRMGIVVKQEYDCLAKYVECFNRLPEINQNTGRKRR